MEFDVLLMVGMGLWDLERRPQRLSTISSDNVNGTLGLHDIG